MAIEYKDVTVRLNVWGQVPAGGIDQQEAARRASITAAPHANAAILDTLNREGAQGWQPADANTDLYRGRARITAQISHQGVFLTVSWYILT